VVVLESLKLDIEHCQNADKFRLLRKIRELEKSQSSKRQKESKIQKIAAEIKTSKRSCEIRAVAIPENIQFPEELPVSGKANEIEELLKKQQVLVIAGDTGSGKTTQIPKICLNAGLGRKGLIGHTQPRRLATVSVANRIAEELNTDVGQGVGYQIRFNETISDSTYLKLMTDGVLLAEIPNDRFLNKYDVIIIDEAHERSLNIDFLLGYLKQLLVKRPELKLIITSATIDVEQFSKYFANAPIVSVSGRTFPVNVCYQPLDKTREDTQDHQQTEAIIDSLNSIVKKDQERNEISGDVLVFLSSEREIRETATVLRKRKLPHTEVLPLYSRLRQSEQIKIFQTHSGRRVVLATNVAETSITVPGIKYVIDTGFARVSRYSIQSKIQRLPIEPVSRSSADQRKGRCGRVSAGICIRLFSEQDYLSRAEYTDPEIKRTNLASVILRMLYLRLGDIDQFPYIDAPEKKAINDGLKLLTELNAITQKRALTQIGKQMARLPLDPKLARMLVVASSLDCLREVLIIVSALSIQDPREPSGDNRQQAQEKHAIFAHEESDFNSLVNLWSDYEEKRQSLSQNQLKKHCKTHYLSYMRMREWREIHRQLLITCQQLGYRVNKEEGTYESIHKSIISGSLNQIAKRFDNRTFAGTRNKKFSLFSSSVAAKNKAKWIVTGELIETTQTFASMAAKIHPNWVERMALHLVNREYFDPHWSKKNQAVMVYEKVHLYGLTIIEKSLVHYSNIDLPKAHSIFISEGLVTNQLSTELKFVTENEKFLDNLSKEEEKLRRPELYAGEMEIVRFYEERIPQEVSTTKKLESWFRKASKEEKHAMRMTRKNILSNVSTRDQLSHFPDHAPILKNQLAIDYVFDPGAYRDGATVQVPQKLLNQIQQADIDWAVPGLIREKCITLLKGLPKSIRKILIPVSGLVDEILPVMNPTDGLLLQSLIANVESRRQIRLSLDDFDQVELPKHLIIKIRIIDESGREICVGENLEKLKADLAINDPQNNFRSIEVIHDIQKSDLKDWDIEELPTQVEIGEDLVMIRYPAYVDNGASVSIQLFADQEEAKITHLMGVARLLMLRSMAQRNSLKQRFIQFKKENALLIPYELNNLVEEAIFRSYADAFELEYRVPHSKQEFENLLSQGKSKLHSIGEKIASLLLLVLKSRFQIRKRLGQLSQPEFNYFVQDIEQQLANLITERLFLDTRVEWLEQYPRYFKAIEARIEKIPHLGRKDKESSEELESYWQKYEELVRQCPAKNAQSILHFRWMLEEYRVSLFAQSLGTKIPVSEQRLEKQLDLIQR